MGNIRAYLDSMNIFVAIYEKRIEIVNVGNRRISIFHMIFSGFFMKKNDRKFKSCNESDTFAEYMGISAEIAGGSPGGIGKYFVDSVGSKAVFISKQFQILCSEAGTIPDDKAALSRVRVFHFFNFPGIFCQRIGDEAGIAYKVYKRKTENAQ